jgi:hypothetical protein
MTPITPEHIATGFDFICAAMTLTYISRLLFQSIVAENPIASACNVAKLSLQGQRVTPRLR